MKILIYGAGVLGSLYAARLKASGNDVWILARGTRAAEISRYGVLLENAATGVRSVTPVRCVENFGVQDRYDFVIVLVRKDQVASVLPSLASNRGVDNFLFMSNNVAGPGAYIGAVGRERVVLGFAGAAGERTGQVVRYAVLPGLMQPTCIGELDGRTSLRVRRIARLFNSAGFPTRIRPNMDAWLKTHAALVSPIANAIYMLGGDIHLLAHDRKGVRVMLDAIREGFRVLRSISIPISPRILNAINLLPEFVLVPLIQRLLHTEEAELIIARHANVARAEMKCIAEELRILARGTRLPTPSMDHLSSFT
jgi:2-dehydropantoate 2-reductase